MEWIWILAALIVGGAFQAAAPMNSANTTRCEETRTLAEDITLVLERYEPIFPRDSWAMTITDSTSTNHVFFQWVPLNGAVSIASVDLAMWPCGVSEKDLDSYYSDETLDVLVSLWDERELTTRCVIDGVRIVEFDLSREDGDYIARFWIEQVSETRVLEGQLTVQAAYASSIDEYAERLYPNTPGCD